MHIQKYSCNKEGLLVLKKSQFSYITSIIRMYKLKLNFKMTPSMPVCLNAPHSEFLK